VMKSIYNSPIYHCPIT